MLSGTLNQQAEGTLATFLNVHPQQARVHQMEVRFDNDHGVWHLVPPYTASLKKAPVPGGATPPSGEEETAAPDNEDHHLLRSGNKTSAVQVSRASESALCILAGTAGAAPSSFAADTRPVILGRGGGPLPASKRSAGDVEELVDAEDGRSGGESGLALPDGAEAPANDRWIAREEADRQILSAENARGESTNAKVMR